MSPSLVVRDGGPQLVVGSAGSLRLRGAVMQIIVNVVGHGLQVEDAIDRPRVHLDEDGVLHCEGGHDPAELERLEGWAGTSPDGATATSLRRCGRGDAQGERSPPATRAAAAQGSRRMIVPRRRATRGLKDGDADGSEPRAGS
jgi:gamma-glutamyltranspeptidase